MRDALASLGLAIFGIACCYAFTVVSFNACATTPTTRPAPCLTTPPPDRQSFLPVTGGTGGCPEAFTWCLSDSSALRLSDGMKEIHTWAAVAYEKCGP